MSSQVDSRSAAGKRARTDSSRREDDWVCPSCKNVNFAFRTTCNMRNCNQSRPANHTNAMQKPMQTPPHYAASGGYMGPGMAPSMYLGGGAPPYGSSMFNGPAMPPCYGIPQFPGSSAYPYGYGSPIPMGRPYGPMQMAGSMMGAGGGDDPFRTYTQLDPRFASSFYPLQPPPFSPSRFGGNSSQALPDGPPGFDLNNSFGTSSAAAPHGVFGRPAHAYAGYTPDPAQRWHLEAWPDRRKATPVTPYHLCTTPCRIMPADSPRVNPHDIRLPPCQAFKGAPTHSTASSSGDNAGLFGNAVHLEEDEGNGDSIGSQGEDNSVEEVVWSSGDDSSDEKYGDSMSSRGEDNNMEVVWSSGDDSSDELYEKLYQGWEDLFGKDNPVFKGMKLVMDSSRSSTKLMKKAILQCMYEESVPCTKHIREIKETGIEWVEKTFHKVINEQEENRKALRQLADEARKKDEEQLEYQHCLKLAKEAGISSNIDEFFFISKHFAGSPSRRAAFLECETSEERRGWITRAFQHSNR